jgi:hypothetical protein
MSEGWSQKGQIAWQLDFAGHMIWDVYYPSGRTEGPTSAPVFDNKRLHRWRWTHLAVVYDHSTARARFYADAHAMGEGALDKHVPICIGPAWIGHWNGHNLGQADPMRNFRGRIDELVIFGRPLKLEELQLMHEAGNPIRNPNVTVQTGKK